ncbi:DUF6069 family protein [Leifsonia shinshuensis]|uniref:DUF6069 family protein n=1 Tax=Leifsonia shinshuensis TaxID=150026 RepID=UPI001F50983B|nr:DUF6069 family protein [Leifsonia shinshuensis]
MSTATRTATHSGVGRITLILIGASIVAVALNALIATAATASGAPAQYGPLLPPAYASMTIVGVVIGWFGWRAVRARARNPRRTLAVLVPVVGVLSFVPDVVLLVTGFVPGTTGAAVLALMTMHVATIAVAVPSYVLASRPQRTATA